LVRDVRSLIVLKKFGATLLDAKVDLNPHQVEAALAFNPTVKGCYPSVKLVLLKPLVAFYFLKKMG
jgi:hypothetical protein